MEHPGRRRSRHRPHLDPLGAIVLPDADDEPARGRERFEAALLPGPSDGARDADVATASALAEAPVRRMAEVLYGSNAVFILELDAPDPTGPQAPMRGVYKPVRGERPLWDFPRRTLYLREVATYLVDAALDLGHVPPTVLRDGPLGPGSVQLYIRGPQRGPNTALHTDDLEAQLHEIAMLDVIVNNADRKRAHLLLREDMRLGAIDNALTFLPYPRQRTALISLGGTRIAAGARRSLHALVSDGERLRALEERLLRLLSAREVAAFVARTRELDRDPVYPMLDDWDGRPFEWW